MRSPSGESGLPVTDPSEWVEQAVRQYPDRLFIRTLAGIRCSYAELADRSARIASALRQRGAQPGDRVAVRVEKSLDAVLLYVACLRLGAVFVPVNTAYSPPEVEYFLSDSQTRIAVVDPAEEALLKALANRAGVEHVLTLGAEGQGSLADLSQSTDSDSLADLSQLADSDSHGDVAPGARWRCDLPRNLSADSLAAIVYTSGTMGRSKGAMLTRANLASNAMVLAEFWRFTGTDVLLHTLPLFHVHGLFVAINTVLVSGSSMVLMPRFEAAEILRYLPQASVFMGVPTHYTRLLQEAGLNREVTGGMRLFVSGSAPLLAETHQQFLQRTGHRILERYGMTETLMNTSNPYEGDRVAGTVGPPLPGVAVRLVNSETGAVGSSAEAIGALEIKGPNVFAGYWRDEQKTQAEFTADGWFKTGDLGRIDDRGYVHIVGRAKDLVISGGYNVYPKEVETELDAVPGIAESAVFGVPHPDFGEGVTAAVVLRAGASVSEDGILAAVRPRLARYKIPKRILIVAELPRNTMGKVQKNLLRAAHAELYMAK